MKDHTSLSRNLTGLGGPVVVGDHAPFCLGHPPVAASSSSRSPMKILMLPRYGREGASSRYRMYNYVPHLESEGFTCESYEMLGNDYLRRRYAGRRRFVWYIASAYARRLAKVIRAESHDLIWLEKEAFPYLPSWFESRHLRSSTPYVVDYDDADFHNYDQHPCRGLYGRYWEGKSIALCMMLRWLSLGINI